MKSNYPVPTSNPRSRTRSERVKVRSRTVLSEQWATLERVSFDYRRADGRWQMQQREIYHRGHGAAILLYNLEKRSIVLIRQFRFPVWTLGEAGFLLEVPAGIIEQGNPEATIQRETQQETGFLIGTPQFLFRAYATPGSVTEQLYYYTAEYDTNRRSGTGGGLEDEGEDIEVLEVSMEEAIDWVGCGRIVDAKTIILLQHAQLHIFSA
ncbi:MAG: NUDIX domain-containing protein [Granulosicoccus sp.]|nr:NUDIX domain-containing protein [Granulosicoccus sp.]